MQSVKKMHEIPAAVDPDDRRRFLPFPHLGKRRPRRKPSGRSRERWSMRPASRWPGPRSGSSAAAEDDPQIVAETTSDEKGQFQIAKQPWDDRRRNDAMPAMLAARDSTGRIGGSSYSDYQRPLRRNVTERFSDQVAGREGLPRPPGRCSGQPIAKATVRPTVWSVNGTGKSQFNNSFSSPPFWRRI